MLAGLTYTGLFHGHIYTSIVNVAFLNERPPSHLSLTHRTYAAHFINNSLADAQQACSDEVILTVLTIFNAEVRDFHFIQIQINVWESNERFL